MLKCHVQAVIAAYNVLSDEAERERYDALRRGRSSNGAHQGEIPIPERAALDSLCNVIQLHS